MGFIIFLICLILGFYLLKWLFRWWLASRLKKLQQQMENAGAQGFYKQYTWSSAHKARRENPSREGEVKVETAAAPNKKIRDRIGDYVDYEEVEVLK
ncbi:MAG: DUF4834 family protein [Rikenellaceae bacterium]|nr:DUF4834 family protein [Rikenellaceae bacterium]